MAAYAALVSLTHLIEQIKLHPDPPLSLDQEQAQFLIKKATFLRGFLEDFHSRGLSHEIQPLESRIADAAHAAEDVIESLVADQIELASQFRDKRRCNKRRGAKRRATQQLYEGLQRVVIQDVEFINKEVMDAQTRRPRDEDDQLRRPHSMVPRGSSPLDKSITMVGFDDLSIRVMGRLAGRNLKREIVPLVGMGGAGKTTLARNIYEKQLIVEHFDMRSWATITQQCVVREALAEILLCLGDQKSREELSKESEQALGDQLHKSLFRRKFLIVLDDVWSIEAWDTLKFFFPDNNNGSRIMITTRSSKLASELTDSPGVEVHLLDEDKSWDLLRKKAFAERSCPVELEEVARTIARNCRGLPLSIVTIGGLLAKSDLTREYLEYVAGNLTSLVNSENDEHCLRVLSLSYIHLPVHIKPCFLYLGIFPEDERIGASFLVRLWVAEGFLKPIGGKASEAVGEEYLKDLVERNLLSVDKWGSSGKIKYCRVHDLLRDLCIREAHKEKFLLVGRTDDFFEIDATLRRVAMRKLGMSSYEDSAHHGAPHVQLNMRSCITDFLLEYVPLRSARLLRILAGDRTAYWLPSPEGIAPLVNSRFISLSIGRLDRMSLLWSTSWNLQTLMIGETVSSEHKKLDIWKMPQLRHVKWKKGGINLSSDPPPSSGVLENLQTLARVGNFVCSRGVADRIPGVKKLGIYYDKDESKGTTSTDYHLDNLRRLQHLESLNITFSLLRKNRRDFLAGLVELPRSLKKLILDCPGLRWDGDTSSMVGSLPNLEVLKLRSVSVQGREWSPVEGQFSLLRFLELTSCMDLKHWNADNAHFPCLESLLISEWTLLEELPSSFGDIPTLRSIVLDRVNDGIVFSAKQMLEEQEDLGNAGLLRVRVRIIDGRRKSELESLASRNFNVYLSQSELGRTLF